MTVGTNDQACTREPTYPDRLALPFVAAPNPLSTEDSEASRSRLVQARLEAVPPFPLKRWSGRWACWPMLVEFTTTDWQQKISLESPPEDRASVEAELQQLARFAVDERADAMGDVLAQNACCVSVFMGLLGCTRNRGRFPGEVVALRAVA